MSAYGVNMAKYNLFQIMKEISERQTITGPISNQIIIAVAKLLDAFGEYLGAKRAEHPTHVSEIEVLDRDARSCFQDARLHVDNSSQYMTVIGIGVQKVSETVRWLEDLSKQPKDLITKDEYDKAVKERKEAENALERILRNWGPPALKEIISKAQSGGLGHLDESWIIAVCSVNLVEAAVNRKLEILGSSTEGKFKERLDRLATLVKEKEGRDIQKVLPRMLYEGPRQLLDHASHGQGVTPEEADQIRRAVVSFLENLFINPVKS